MKSINASSIIMEFRRRLYGKGMRRTPLFKAVTTLCAANMAVTGLAPAVYAANLPQMSGGYGAGMEVKGQTLTIDGAQGSGSSFTWDRGFNIGQGYTVQFQNIAAAVNKDTSGQLSCILGSLYSSGAVYILNPNGILFGSSAVVDVHGLIAAAVGSASKGPDGDFVFSKFGSGNVVNQGSIRAGNFAYLVGKSVENSGSISAKDVALAAFGGTGADSITIASTESGAKITFQIPEGAIAEAGEDDGGEVAVSGTITGIQNEQASANGGARRAAATTPDPVVDELGNISFSAANVKIESEQTGKSVTINATKNIDIGNGAVEGGVSVTATEGDIVATAGNYISVHKDATLTSEKGGVNFTAKGNINMAGVITANSGDVTLTAQGGTKSVKIGFDGGKDDSAYNSDASVSAKNVTLAGGKSAQVLAGSVTATAVEGEGGTVSMSGKEYVAANGDITGKEVLLKATEAKETSTTSGSYSGDAGVIQLSGTITAADKLDISSAGMIEAQGTIKSEKQTDLSAEGGQINLTGTGNVIGGTVNVTGTDVNIVNGEGQSFTYGIVKSNDKNLTLQGNAQDVTIANNISITGDFTVENAGDIELNASIGAANITFNGTQTTVAGNITGTGDLNVKNAAGTATADLTQSSGDISVANITAKNITQNGGTMTASGQISAKIDDSTFGTITQAGDASTKMKADTITASQITQTGGKITATTKITANVTQFGCEIDTPVLEGNLTQEHADDIATVGEITGSVTQEKGLIRVKNTDNDYTNLKITGVLDQDAEGTIDVTGGKITLESNATVAGMVTAEEIDATGKTLTQDGAGTITVTGANGIKATTVSQTSTGTVKADKIDGAVEQTGAATLQANTPANRLTVTGKLTQNAEGAKVGTANENVTLGKLDQDTGAITAKKLTLQDNSTVAATVTAEEIDATGKTLTQDGAGTITVTGANGIKATTVSQTSTGTIKADKIDGAVSQTGAATLQANTAVNGLTVTGTLTQDNDGAKVGTASENVTLGKLDQDKGAITAKKLTLQDNSTVAATVTAEEIDATGKTLTQDGAGTITVTGANGIKATTVSQTSTGTVKADKIDGAVSQTGAATLQANTAANGLTVTGKLTQNAEGAKVGTANEDVTLGELDQDKGAITAKKLTLQADGNEIAGTITADAITGGKTVEIQNGGDVNATAITADLTVKTGATVDTKSGTGTLAITGNLVQDGGGVATVAGENVTVSGTTQQNGGTLGNATGTVGLDGALTQNGENAKLYASTLTLKGGATQTKGVVEAGTLDLQKDAGGNVSDVSLAQTGNKFGTVQGEAGNIDIYDSESGLNLAELSAYELKLVTAGALTQVAEKKITATGLADITSTGGDILLTAANNELTTFKANASAASKAVKVVNAQAIEVQGIDAGTATARGDVLVKATGDDGTINITTAPVNGNNVTLNATKGITEGETTPVGATVNAAGDKLVETAGGDIAVNEAWTINGKGAYIAEAGSVVVKDGQTLKADGDFLYVKANSISGKTEGKEIIAETGTAGNKVKVAGTGATITYSANKATVAGATKVAANTADDLVVANGTTALEVGAFDAANADVTVKEVKETATEDKTLATTGALEGITAKSVDIGAGKVTVSKSVTATGGDIDIASAGAAAGIDVNAALTASGNSVILGAGDGTIALGANVTADDITLKSTTEQSGGIVKADEVILNAAGKDVKLDKANEIKAVGGSAKAVTLNTTTALKQNALTATGKVDLDATGALTQSGDLNAAGKAVELKGSEITLSKNVTADSLKLENDATAQAGTISVTTLDATGKTLTVNGAGDVDVGETLTAATLDVDGGTVDAKNITATAKVDQDGGKITVAETITGDVEQKGATDAVTLSAKKIDGALTQEAGNNGVVTVGNVTGATVQNGGKILKHADAEQLKFDFTVTQNGGTIASEADNVFIFDKFTQSGGTLNASQLKFSRNVEQTAAAGTVNAAAILLPGGGSDVALDKGDNKIGKLSGTVRNLAIRDTDGGLVVGDNGGKVEARGTVTLEATAGDITQEANLVASGLTTLTAKNVNLANSEWNSFNGGVTATATADNGDVRIVHQNIGLTDNLDVQGVEAGNDGKRGNVLVKAINGGIAVNSAIDGNNVTLKADNNITENAAVNAAADKYVVSANGNIEVKAVGTVGTANNTGNSAYIADNGKVDSTVNGGKLAANGFSYIRAANKGSATPESTGGGKTFLKYGNTQFEGNGGGIARDAEGNIVFTDAETVAFSGEDENVIIQSTTKGVNIGTVSSSSDAALQITEVLATASPATQMNTLDGTGGTSAGGKGLEANKVTVNVKGNVTQDGDANVIAHGNTSITSTDGKIELANAGNDFQGSVDMSGTSIAIKDANSITLGNITAKGDNGSISIEALNGSVTVASGKTVKAEKGDVALTAKSDTTAATPATDPDIVIDNATVQAFAGSTAAGSIKLAASRNITIDPSILESNDDIDVDAGGDVVIEGSRVSSAKKITIGKNANIGGDIIVRADASDTRSLVTAGTGIKAAAEGDISIAKSTVQVTGGTAAEDPAISLTAHGGTGVTSDNDAQIDATGADLDVVADNDSGKIELKGKILAKDADFTAKEGTTGQAITADNAANDFTGTVTADGASAKIIDANDISLGNVTANGNATTGNVLVETVKGSITVLDSATVKSEKANVTLTASTDASATEGDIVVNGKVIADNTATLTAEKGSITDKTDETIGHGDAETSPWATGTYNTHVKAKDAVLLAKAIGAAGKPLDTEVETIDATATAGSVYVWEKDAIEVKKLSATKSDTAAGNAELETLDGAIKLVGTATAVGGNILLGAKTSGSSGILSAGDLTLNGDITAADGAVSLLAGGSLIEQNADVTAKTIDVETFHKNAEGVADGTISITAGNTVNATEALRYKGAKIENNGTIKSENGSGSFAGALVNKGTIKVKDFAATGSIDGPDGSLDSETFIFKGDHLGEANKAVSINASTIAINAKNEVFVSNGKAATIGSGIAAQDAAGIARVHLDGTTTQVGAAPGGVGETIAGVVSETGNVSVKNNGKLTVNEAVGASAAGKNAVLETTAGDIELNAGVTAGQNATILAKTAVDQNATITATAGDAWVEAQGGSVTMKENDASVKTIAGGNAYVAATGAKSADPTLDKSGDVKLTVVQAANGKASVFSEDGAIIDNLQGGADAANIVAKSARLQAGTSVGGANAADIDTTVDNIEVKAGKDNSADGTDAFVHNTKAVTVGGVNGVTVKKVATATAVAASSANNAGGDLTGAEATKGNVSILADGQMTVAEAVSAATAGKNAVLETTAGGIVLNAGVTAGQDATILAKTSIDQNATVTATDGDAWVEAQGGSVTMKDDAAVKTVAGGNAYVAATGDSGDVSLSLVEVTGTGDGKGYASIYSKNGSIKDNLTAGETAEAEKANVKAQKVRLEAKNDIGRANDADIETSADKMELLAKTGDAFVHNVKALDIGNVGDVKVNKVATETAAASAPDKNAGADLVGAEATAGNLSILADGKMTVLANEAVSAEAAEKNVALETTAGDIELNAEVTAGQDATVVAAGKVDQNATITAKNGDVWVEAKGGSVTMKENDATVRTVAEKGSVYVAATGAKSDDPALNKAGDVKLTVVDARKGTVSVFSEDGSIFDNLQGSGDAANILAQKTRLEAGAGIGGAGNADIDATLVDGAATGKLELEAGTDAFVHNTTALEIGNVGDVKVKKVDTATAVSAATDKNAGADLVGAKATAGNLSILADGQMTVNEAADAGANAVLETTADGIELNAGVTAAQNATILAKAAVDQNATITATAGDAWVEAQGGSVTMANGTTTTAKNKAYVAATGDTDETKGDVKLSLVKTTAETDGAVSVYSAKGSIKDNLTAGETSDTENANVVAQKVHLEAGAAIGDENAADIETTADNIEILAGTDAFVHNTKAVTVGGVGDVTAKKVATATAGPEETPARADLVGASSTAGDVRIVAKGAMTVAEAVSAKDIRLESTDDAVTLNDTVTADKNLTIASNGKTEVAAGKKVSAARDLYVKAGGDVKLNATGDSKAEAGETMALVSENGSIKANSVKADTLYANAKGNVDTGTMSAKNMALKTGGDFVTTLLEDAKLAVSAGGNVTIHANGHTVQAGAVAGNGANAMTVTEVVAAGEPPTQEVELADTGNGGALNGIVAGQNVSIDNAKNVSGTKIAANTRNATIYASGDYSVKDTSAGGRADLDIGGSVQGGANVSAKGETKIRTDGSVDAGSISGSPVIVNAGGSFKANSVQGGNVTIDAAGVTADTVKGGDITVTSTGSADFGKLVEGKTIDITAKGVTSTGDINGNEIMVESHGAVAVNNVNGGTVDINANGGRIETTRGGVIKSTDLTLQGGDIDVTLDSQKIKSINGSNVTINELAHDHNVTLGTISASGNLDLTALQIGIGNNGRTGYENGSLAASGDINLNVAGRMGSPSDLIAINRLDGKMTLKSGDLHSSEVKDELKNGNRTKINFFYLLMDDKAKLKGRTTSDWWIGYKDDDRRPIPGIVLLGSRLLQAAPGLMNKIYRALAFTIETPELKSKQGVFGSPLFVHTDMDVSEAASIGTVDYVSIADTVMDTLADPDVNDRLIDLAEENDDPDLKKRFDLQRKNPLGRDSLYSKEIKGKDKAAADKEKAEKAKAEKAKAEKSKDKAPAKAEAKADVAKK